MQQKHFQVKPDLNYSFDVLREYFREEPITDEENIVISTYDEKIVELKLVVENLGELARNLKIKSTTYPYIRKNEPKFEYSTVLNINFEIDGPVAAELTEEECHVTFLFEVTYQNVYGKIYRDQLTCVVESVYDLETDQIYLSPTLEKVHAMII